MKVWLYRLLMLVLAAVVVSAFALYGEMEGEQKDAAQQQQHVAPSATPPAPPPRPSKEDEVMKNMKINP